MSDPLPEFDNPPVVEVALSVQFDPLVKLRTPQLGLLWKEFGNDFPRIEEHPPIEPISETFGTRSAPTEPRVRVEMLRKPQVPRCWFLNEHGTELIQVQNDRFVHNWRKVQEGQEYPRFEKHIRPRFDEEFARLQQFFEREQIGVLTPNQCEVTYVNHIESCQVWAKHGELAKVFAYCTELTRSEFLQEPEELRMHGSFVIRRSAQEPIGRLRYSIEPAFRRSDDRPVFVLTLVARGSPIDDSAEGAMAFIDLGREWIVRGFADMTTPEMHKIWGRTQ